jgi:pyruvate ferredoxin oxidoreductase delta subunit
MTEDKLGWREMPEGAVPYKCTLDYETGDWGVEYPEIDYARCSKCMLCHFYCPEGAVRVRSDGYTEIDRRYCKGCGICVEECPLKCMKMVRKV